MIWSSSTTIIFKLTRPMRVIRYWLRDDFIIDFRLFLNFMKNWMLLNLTTRRWWGPHLILISSGWQKSAPVDQIVWSVGSELWSYKKIESLALGTMERHLDWQTAMKEAARDAMIMSLKGRIWISACVCMLKSQPLWRQEGIDAWEQHYTRRCTRVSYAPKW